MKKVFIGIAIIVTVLFTVSACMSLSHAGHSGKGSQKSGSCH